MKLNHFLLFFIVVMTFSACTNLDTTVTVTPIPIVAKKSASRHLSATKDKQLMGTLTLERAINLTLEKNPRVLAARLNIQANEARASQESRFPNPELEFGMENFGGGSSLSGFQANETTLGIGQLFELGNKRKLRTQLANTFTQRAALEYEVMRLNLLTQVREAYAQAAAAEVRLELTKKLLELSDRFNSTVDTLVQAGRYSAAEKARAEVEYQNTRMSRLQAEGHLRSSRQELASMWGGASNNFTTINTDDVEHPRLPARDKMLNMIGEVPAVRLADLDIISRSAAVDYAKAQRIPDPTFRAGIRRLNEVGSQALLAGISIPIPMNRNQDGIREALFRRDQGNQLLEAEKIQVLSLMNTQLDALETLEIMLTTLKESIIPEAERAYTIINQNYGRGQYGLIDVIDSQRQLFDAQLQYLDTRLEYDTRIIQLEGLLGQPISTL